MLANDFNPFANDGVPLRVIGAAIDQQSVGTSASVNYSATGITVRTGAAFTGTLSVIYRIEDGTKDPARQVQGRVIVVVKDEPDKPNAPVVVSKGDSQVTIRWNAPAPNNSAIDAYQVQYNGAVPRLRCRCGRREPAVRRPRQRHRVLVHRARAQRHRLERVVQPGGGDPVRAARVRRPGCAQLPPDTRPRAST